MFVQVDVSDEEEVRSAIEQTVNRFGRLDCAFNNAGIGGGPGSLVDSTREVWGPCDRCQSHGGLAVCPAGD